MSILNGPFTMINNFEYRDVHFAAAHEAIYGDFFSVGKMKLPSLLNCIYQELFISVGRMVRMNLIKK